MNTDSPGADTIFIGRLPGALAAVASLLAIISAVLIAGGDDGAGWVAAFGAGAIVLGVLGGFRPLVGGGAVTLALSSAIATHESSTILAVVVNALVAAAVMLILVTVDMSFAARPTAIVSMVAIQGLATVYAAAIIGGAALAAAVVAGVLAFSLPGWLLLLPAVVLSGVAIVLGIGAHGYRKKMSPAAPER